MPRLLWQFRAMHGLPALPDAAIFQLKQTMLTTDPSPEDAN